MLSISMMSALQFHVVNPKRYAVPSYGKELPPFDPSDSLDNIVPIWNKSLQCLLDDDRNGGRVLADALGRAWGTHVKYLDGAIAFGGWKGDACPVLMVYLHRVAVGEASAMSLINPENARELGRWLLDATQADCVTVSNMYKQFRVEVTPAIAGGAERVGAR